LGSLILSHKEKLRLTVIAVFFFLCNVITPSLYSDSLSDGTQIIKSLFFIVLIGLVAIPYLVFSIADLIIKVTYIDVLCFIYLLFCCFNRANCFSYSIKFCELIALAFLYIVSKSVASGAYKFILFAILLGALVQIGMGYMQLYGLASSNNASFCITGAYYNPGPYAGYLAVAMPIAAGSIIFKLARFENDAVNYRWKFISRLNLCSEYLPVMVLIIGGVLLPYTESRAAMLSAFISCLYLFNYKYKITSFIKRNLFARYTLGLLIIILVMGVIVYLHYSNSDSIRGRILIWKVSLRMVTQHPLCGVGYDNFRATYMNYQADYFKGHLQNTEVLLAGNIDYAFNELIQSFVELGTIGLLLILSVITAILAKRQTVNKPIFHVAFAVLLAIFVFSLFSYPSEILPLKITAVSCLAIMSSHFSVINTIKFNHYEVRKIKWIASILLFPAVLISLYFAFITWQGYSNWYQAKEGYAIGDYDNSITDFEYADKQLSTNGVFLMQYGKALNKHNQYQKSIEVLNKASKFHNSPIVQTTLGDDFFACKKYSMAEQAYYNAFWMVPNRFYPLYCLIKLYAATGQSQKQNDIANMILAKPIKIPSAAITQIRAKAAEIIHKENVKNARARPDSLSLYLDN